MKKALAVVALVAATTGLAAPAANAAPTGDGFIIACRFCF